MQFSHIRSPLLRYIVIFYGNLGFQLERIDFNHYQNKSTLLNILLNLSINLILLYASFALDPFADPSDAQSLDESNKPSTLLMNFDTYYIWPHRILFIRLYIYLYGPKLMELLDSEMLQEAFQKHSKSYHKLTFALLFAIGHYLSYWEYGFDLKDRWHRDGPLRCVIIAIYLYVTFFDWFFPYVVLHYLQLGVYLSLDNNTRLSGNSFEHLRPLAALGRTRDRLLSAPLTVFFTALVFDSTAMVCVYLPVSLLHPYVVDALICWAYLIYLVWLDTRIQGILSKLDRHSRREFFEDLSNCGQVRVLGAQSIYFQDLSVHLYRMAVVDGQFCVNASLVMFGYSVLFLQTSNPLSSNSMMSSNSTSSTSST